VCTYGSIRGSKMQHLHTENIISPLSRFVSLPGILCRAAPQEQCTIDTSVRLCDTQETLHDSQVH